MCFHEASALGWRALHVISEVLAQLLVSLLQLGNLFVPCCRDFRPVLELLLLARRNISETLYLSSHGIVFGERVVTQDSLAELR
ncbi:hypothetical protein C8R47DRAFT_104766 [Mycena vitilis]|nr:hypothetical protein C8R47DRAFT_104766 [Mycena vitilis]